MAKQEHHVIRITSDTKNALDELAARKTKEVGVDISHQMVARSVINNALREAGLLDHEVAA